MNNSRLNKSEELFLVNNESMLNELAIPKDNHYINVESILKFIFISINIFLICYNVTSELQEPNINNIANKINNENSTYNINMTAIQALKIKTPKNKNKTIAVIFAGRKRYLELLLKYLNVLKDYERIEEIHFWQFTNVKEDLDYLNSIANLHKTTGKFNDFKEIYPLIENNEFNISIKQEKEKGGAVLLINDKYEITFQFIDELTMEISIKIGDNIFTTRQKNMYNPKEYSNYNIKVINKQMIITGKNDLYIKISFEDNIINTTKIHSTKNSMTYWDYKEIINKGYKLYDSNFREYNHWYEAFKFYLDYDFDILIKVDDDITFIDLYRFDEFIDYINLFKKNITIPNLINHAVSLFYNNKDGLVPDNILNKKYIKKASSLKIFDYYKDGKESVKIHDYFLNNLDKFINNNMEPRNLNGQKPSICMFGITKEAYVQVYNQNTIYKSSTEPDNYHFSDEVYTYRLLNNYIYPRFVCAHYAFGPQRKSGLNESFLERYESLSREYLK